MEHRDDTIIRMLESLRAIEPSEDFAARSRAIICATGRPPSGLRQWGVGFLVRVQLGVVLTVVGLILLVIAGSFSLRVREDLNDRKILSEAKNMQFQIRLDEISYFEESAKEVSVALEKISEVGR